MSNPNIAYDVCRMYVADYAHHLPGDLINKILGYVRARDLTKLADVGNLFDQNIHDQNTFRTLRQISAFFKKNADFSDAEVCEHAARSSFDDGERICSETNARLEDFYAELHVPGGDNEDLKLQVQRMSSFIARVLGSKSEFVRDLPERIRFTNGATATRPRRKALSYQKLSGKIPCAPRAKKYIQSLAKWFGYDFVKTSDSPVNRVITVPKNWKTHRTIACEPDGNIPLQLAFDSFLKSRLRRKARVDLSNQFRNQDMAKLGSIDGRFATIDLSMASDTLALNTVHLLFPQEWTEYLCDIRSGFYRFNDEPVRKYHKFSSMGNGCTFGIETLVFASACYAVGSEQYSVYGDDIIIETELYFPLVKLLAFLGFVVNEEKSYHTGPFRESCGKDYFNGYDVTPFYLREWKDRKTVLCHNLNGLVMLGYPGSRLFRFCLDLVIDRRLPLVPRNQDTCSGIHIPEEDAYNLGLIKHRNHIPYFHGYVSKDAKREIYDSRTLFLWHHAAAKIPFRGESLIRSSVPFGLTRYVRSKVLLRVQPDVTPLQLYGWGELFSSPFGAKR